MASLSPSDFVRNIQNIGVGFHQKIEDEGFIRLCRGYSWGVYDLWVIVLDPLSGSVGNLSEFADVCRGIDGLANTNERLTR